MKLKNFSRRSFIAMAGGAMAIAAANARPLHGGVASGGGAPGDLVAWTITEQSGSGQTNVPVEIPVPFAAGNFLSTDAIQVVDSDGTTVLDVDEHYRASDVNSDLRLSVVTAILPTLTANQARQLTIKKVPSTSPATGTNASTANIIATSYDCVATVAFKNGTTYTASAADALAASTWTDKDTLCNYGITRGGGGIVTEYVVYAPFKTGGGSRCPGNLYAKFVVTAYKLGRGAVSGGNPITRIRTKAWLGSGFVKQTSPIDCWYDLTITSGSNTLSWVGSSPAKTLTLSSNAGVAAITLSTTTNTFTADSVGNIIDDGTGYAVITGYTDAQHVTAILYKVMSGTSISSGNWRIFGINHPNSALIPQQEIWYSGLGAKPNLDSTLGVAWNAGTLTGGPFTYFNSCAMVLPYSTPASAITNSLSGLNACGTNPSGYFSLGAGNGLAGDITMYMPQTGGREEIGPIPGWFVGAMIRSDANAKPVIFGQANKMALATIHYIDDDTGATVRLDNGDNYTTSAPLGGTWIEQVGAGGINNWTPQTAHMATIPYVPYLYSGDFFWLDMMQSHSAFTWTQNNPGYWGSGLNRLECISDETRGCGWDFTKLAHAGLCTPDVAVPGLGWDKSQPLTWLANHMTATNSGDITMAPFPGAIIRFMNNTGGAGKTYATAGPHWINGGGQGGIFSMWMHGYCTVTFFQIKLLGMADVNFLSFMAWVIEGLTYAATNTTDVVPEMMVPSYWMDMVFPTGTQLKEGVDIYRATAIDCNYAGDRILGTGVTLSGLSGTITCTFPPGTLSSGGTAFYQDGAVRDNLGGCGKIVSISGDTVTMTTVGSLPQHDSLPPVNCAPFSSTSLSAGNFYLPWAAPGDDVGVRPSPSSYAEYWDIAQSAAILYAADGYADGAAALAFINSKYSGGNDLKWRVS